MDVEDETTFNEVVQEFQQQFVCYRGVRFQELEELIEVAIQKMETLEKMTVKKKGDARFVNSVVKPRSSGNDLLESLYHSKSDFPKFDELPGEDKEDWHSEEIICIALGLEDSFKPKKNSEQENSSGAKELECTFDFSISPRKIRSNGKKELDEPIESEEPEHQIPKDLIASTKLDELRLQTAPCFIPRCQDGNSSKAYKEESKDYDKETGSSHQHSSKEIQVNYKITSDEAKEEVTQLLIGGEQASETLKAKRDVVMGAQIHHLSKSGIVGKFPREKLPCFEYAIEEESSIILTNIRELVKDVVCKESVPAANSCDLVKIPSNFGMENMVIFYLGGQVQNKQFEVDTSSGTKGWECTTDVMEPFALVLAAVVAYMPQKVRYKQKGESKLRVAPNEMIYAVRKEWDQPKELKPELQVPEDLSIHLDRLKLQCDPYLISTSPNVVPPEVGKAIGSTQQQLYVGILVYYKTITIFYPGGYPSCLYEANFAKKISCTK